MDITEEIKIIDVGPTFTSFKNLASDNGINLNIDLEINPFSIPLIEILGGNVSD